MPHQEADQSLEPIEHLRDYDIHALSKWLQESLLNDDFTPISGSKYKSPVLDFYQTVKKSSSSWQMRIKEALVLAVFEWPNINNVEQLNQEALQQAIRLACYLNLDQIVYMIPTILHTLKDEDYRDNETCKLMLSALIKFAHSEKSYQILSSLYQLWLDDLKQVRLIIGLSKHDPKDFIHYVPQLLDCLDKLSHTWVMSQLEQFIDAVPRDILFSQIILLSPTDQRRFLQYLFGIKDSPLEIVDTSDMGDKKVTVRRNSEIHPHDQPTDIWPFINNEIQGLLKSGM